MSVCDFFYFDDVSLLDNFVLCLFFSNKWYRYQSNLVTKIRKLLRRSANKSGNKRLAESVTKLYDFFVGCFEF